MKRKTDRIAVAVLIVTFLLSTVVLAGEEIKLPPMKSKTLSNGLEILIIEHHELPMVAFRLVLRTGTAYDPGGQAGLANLTADLLRKGTNTRSATEIAETIDFVGGLFCAGHIRL